MLKVGEMTLLVCWIMASSDELLDGSVEKSKNSTESSDLWLDVGEGVLLASVSTTWNFDAVALL